MSIKIEKMQEHKHFKDCFKLIDENSVFIVDINSKYFDSVLRLSDSKHFMAFVSHRTLMLAYPGFTNTYDDEKIIVANLKIVFGVMDFFIIKLYQDFTWVKDYSIYLYNVILKYKEEKDRI